MKTTSKSDGPLKFLSVERVRCVEGYGVIVTFSDGTRAYFPPEELAALRPYRETGDVADETVELGDHKRIAMLAGGAAEL